MFKVLLTVTGVLALTYAASAEVIVEGCQSQTDLWGSVDGTKFYFCLPDSNLALEQSCPPETFFVSNATVLGCVPMDLMNPNCVNLEPVGPCTGINLSQPQPSIEPTQFYICTAENSAPVLLTCPDNMAFVKQSGYLGCFDWETWRQVRECFE